jgi:DNA polymerase-1
MIDAFNNNRDLHSITAIAAFGLNCTEDEVKKLYKEYRDKAKGLNFGVVYGIGAGKYADNVGISQAQAKKAIRGFYDTYKGVEKYLYAIEDYGVKNRHVKTLAGRKLQLYFDPSNEKEISMARRNARNYPIQGTSADILKLALGLLYPRLKPFKDAWVVNIVHDEIIIECNREDGEAVKEILSEAMLEAAYRYLPDIYVEAEASVAEDWSEK